MGITVTFALLGRIGKRRAALSSCVSVSCMASSLVSGRGICKASLISYRLLLGIRNSILSLRSAFLCSTLRYGWTKSSVQVLCRHKKDTTEKNQSCPFFYSSSAFSSASAFSFSSSGSFVARTLRIRFSSNSSTLKSQPQSFISIVSPSSGICPSCPIR